jgi:hypothetical protein
LFGRILRFVENSGPFHEFDNPFTSCDERRCGPIERDEFGGRRRELRFPFP